jgi:hypothetical protein
MEHIVTIHDPYTVSRVGEVWQRFKWLKENVGERNYRLTKVDYNSDRRSALVFEFQDINHAIMFKLTWGGK